MAGLEKLANLDAHDLERVNAAVTRAVRYSFATDAQRQGKKEIKPSQWDVKQRIEMAIDIVRLTYCEKQWGLLRVLDKLPELLRRRLDNKDWDILASDERTIWMPGDGR